MIFLNDVMTRGVHHRQPLKRKLVGLMTVQPETPVLGFKTHTLNIFQMARSSSKGRANHTSYYSLPSHYLAPPTAPSLRTTTPCRLSTSLPTTPPLFTQNKESRL